MEASKRIKAEPSPRVSLSHSFVDGGGDGMDIDGRANEIDAGEGALDHVAGTGLTELSTGQGQIDGLARSADAITFQQPPTFPAGTSWGQLQTNPTTTAPWAPLPFWSQDFTLNGSLTMKHQQQQADYVRYNETIPARKILSTRAAPASFPGQGSTPESAPTTQQQEQQKTDHPPNSFTRPANPIVVLPASATRKPAGPYKSSGLYPPPNLSPVMPPGLTPPFRPAVPVGPAMPLDPALPVVPGPGMPLGGIPQPQLSLLTSIPYLILLPDLTSAQQRNLHERTIKITFNIRRAMSEATQQRFRARIWNGLSAQHREMFNVRRPWQGRDPLFIHLFLYVRKTLYIHRWSVLWVSPPVIAHLLGFPGNENREMVVMGTLLSATHEDLEALCASLERQGLKFDKAEVARLTS